jgi:hypothetical protein
LAAVVNKLVPVVSHLATMGNELALLVNFDGDFGQFGWRCAVSLFGVDGQRSGFS